MTTHDGEDGVQIGGGQNLDPLIKHLTSTITTSVLNNLQNSNFVFGPSTSAVYPQASVESEDQPTLPEIPAGYAVKKNQEHDKFDLKLLVRLVPRRQKKVAKELLLVFEEKPEEINFDSAGRIFIDETSIPLGNINVIFPLLFKKGNHSKVPGFLEVKKKVFELGIKLPFESKTDSTNLSTSTKTESSDFDDPHWYYIGP